MSTTYDFTRLGAVALLLSLAPCAPTLAQPGSPAPAALIAQVRDASAHLGTIYQERISHETNPAKVQKLSQQRDTDLTALDELVKDAGNTTTETTHDNRAYRVAAAHLGTVYAEELKRNPTDQQLKTQRNKDVTAVQELIRFEQGGFPTHTTSTTLTQAQRDAAASAATANYYRLHPRPTLTQAQRDAAAQAATAAREKAAGH